MISATNMAVEGAAISASHAYSPYMHHHLANHHMNHLHLNHHHRTTASHHQERFHRNLIPPGSTNAGSIPSTLISSTPLNLGSVPAPLNLGSSVIAKNSNSQNGPIKVQAIHPVKHHQEPVNLGSLRVQHMQSIGMGSGDGGNDLQRNAGGTEALLNGVPHEALFKLHKSASAEFAKPIAKHRYANGIPDSHSQPSTPGPVDLAQPKDSNHNHQPKYQKSHQNQFNHNHYDRLADPQTKTVLNHYGGIHLNQSQYQGLHDRTRSSSRENVDTLNRFNQDISPTRLLNRDLSPSNGNQRLAPPNHRMSPPPEVTKTFCNRQNSSVNHHQARTNFEPTNHHRNNFAQHFFQYANSNQDLANFYAKEIYDIRSGGGGFVPPKPPAVYSNHHDVKPVDFKQKCEGRRGEGEDHQAFKIPSGKEGSLKHRILRPSPPASVAPLSPQSPLLVNSSTATPTVSSGFSRGALIRLADGDVRRVEDMRADDFRRSAEVTGDVTLTDVTVVRISTSGAGETSTRDGAGAGDRITLTLSFNQHRDRVDFETDQEHPFFVYGQGWASFSPEATMRKYGLKCNRLQVGDICISLTPKEPTVAPNHCASRSLQALKTAKPHYPDRTHGSRISSEPSYQARQPSTSQMTTAGQHLRQQVTPRSQPGQPARSLAYTYQTAPMTTSSQSMAGCQMVPGQHPMTSGGQMVTGQLMSSQHPMTTTSGVPSIPRSATADSNLMSCQENRIDPGSRTSEEPQNLTTNRYLSDKDRQRLADDGYTNCKKRRWSAPDDTLLASNNQKYYPKRPRD